MCEDTRARIRVLDGALGTNDRIVLISSKEEPEARLSPAMNAVIRVFRRITGLSETDGEGSSSGGAVCSFRLLVASSQAINLIGKQGSLIKSIQESSVATVRVLSGEEVPHYATSDERIVEIQGEASKVLKALEAIVGHLRKFLVDHSVIPLFEKTLPRLYNIYRKMGTATSFQNILDNVFLPLFEVTVDPNSHPQLHVFLKQVVGFDLVDDESKPERRPTKHMPTPAEWTNEFNPAYAYYTYYCYANLYTLNKLRESKGMPTIKLRPHCGEVLPLDFGEWKNLMDSDSVWSPNQILTEMPPRLTISLMLYLLPFMEEVLQQPELHQMIRLLHE
ncbi:hypothetical protein MKW94_028352 [Papaver nudicaule]|uniref:K Homology domain-containing protein n=1 Tax=Papaver nudicaule TaxID=74823 RepID=A0AA41RVS4_PAPNU|nr:hypothetical protein [Papaver nudicaule]